MSATPEREQADMRYRRVLGVSWVRYGHGWSLGRLDVHHMRVRGFAVGRWHLRLGFRWLIWRTP